MNNIRITIQPRKGSNIEDVCSEAKELSEILRQDLTFTFNRVDISTHGKSITEMVESYTICRSE